MANASSLKAAQRLALAKSLQLRLGVDSPLTKLPGRADGGGDLHEKVTRRPLGRDRAAAGHK